MRLETWAIHPMKPLKSSFEYHEDEQGMNSDDAKRRWIGENKRSNTFSGQLFQTGKWVPRGTIPGDLWCDDLGKYPKLVGAISNVGGFGQLPGGNAPVEALEREITLTREVTDKPFQLEHRQAQSHSRHIIFHLLNPGLEGKSQIHSAFH